MLLVLATVNFDVVVVVAVFDQLEVAVAGNRLLVVIIVNNETQLWSTENVNRFTIVNN